MAIMTAINNYYENKPKSQTDVDDVFVKSGQLVEPTPTPDATYGKQGNINAPATPNMAQNGTGVQQKATIGTDASQLQGKQPVTRNVFAPKPLIEPNLNPALGGKTIGTDASRLAPIGSTPQTNPNGAPTIVQPVQPSAQLDFSKPAKTQNTEKTQPMNYQQFRDAMFGSEEEKRKKANNMAKVLAIGDALRHIGNLAYVSGMGPGAGGAFASPQQYKTAPAGEEVAKYDAGKKERDAMGWQAMKYAQAQRAAQLDREIKQNQWAAEQAEKQRKNDADIKYRNAQTDKTLMDMQINAEKYPYEIKELIARAAKTGADADLAIAKAEIEKKYGPQEAEAKISEIKASTAQHYASAESSRASAAKTRKETAQIDNDVIKFPVWSKDGSGKMRYQDRDYTMPNNKSTKQNVVNQLADYAKKQGWVSASTGAGDNAHEEGGSSKSAEYATDAMFNAIMEHASDPQVQRVISRMSGESSGEESGRPGSSAKKSKSGGSKGSSSGKKFDF